MANRLWWPTRSKSSAAMPRRPATRSRKKLVPLSVISLQRPRLRTEWRAESRGSRATRSIQGRNEGGGIRLFTEKCIATEFEASVQAKPITLMHRDGFGFYAALLCFC
jgi:hypothetical protein